MSDLIKLILSFFKTKEDEIDTELLKAREEEASSSTKPENKPIEFKNNSERLQKEYNQLRNKNMPLYNLLTELNNFTNKKFKKNILITMIYRTQAEQDYLYRNSERYQKEPFRSPHQFWHATDLRSRTFTQTEIDEIVLWLNEKYNNDNYYSWTSKCHEVGSNGSHFHIQYYKV